MKIIIDGDDNAIMNYVTDIPNLIKLYNHYNGLFVFHSINNKWRGMFWQLKSGTYRLRMLLLDENGDVKL